MGQIYGLGLCCSRLLMANQAFSTVHRMVWSRAVAAVVVMYLLVAGPPPLLPAWTLELGEAVGLILLATAAFGRLWCLLFVAGRKNEQVVREGPYSVVRNPLYVFSLLGAVGFGLAVENPLLAAVLGLGFIAYYHFVIRSEERFLLSAFGKNYSAYLNQVPRKIPSFKLYHSPRTIEVDTTKVLRGIGDAMWFVWAFVLWELVEVMRSFVLPMLLA
jgi:protein-S-isoprenylcysteine O-methyltransferase Ste14